MNAFGRAGLDAGQLARREVGAGDDRRIAGANAAVTIVIDQASACGRCSGGVDARDGIGTFP